MSLQLSLTPSLNATKNTIDAIVPIAVPRDPAAVTAQTMRQRMTPARTGPESLRRFVQLSNAKYMTKGARKAVGSPRAPGFWLKNGTRRPATWTPSTMAATTTTR